MSHSKFWSHSGTHKSTVTNACKVVLFLFLLDIAWIHDRRAFKFILCLGPKISLYVVESWTLQCNRGNMRLTMVFRVLSAYRRLYLYESVLILSNENVPKRNLQNFAYYEQLYLSTRLVSGRKIQPCQWVERISCPWRQVPPKLLCELAQDIT